MIELDRDLLERACELGAVRRLARNTPPSRAWRVLRWTWFGAKGAFDSSLPEEFGASRGVAKPSGTNES